MDGRGINGELIASLELNPINLPSSSVSGRILCDTEVSNKLNFLVSFISSQYYESWTEVNITYIFQLFVMKLGRRVPLDPGSDIGYVLSTSNTKPFDYSGKSVTVTQFLMVARG